MRLTPLGPLSQNESRAAALRQDPEISGSLAR